MNEGKGGPTDRPTDRGPQGGLEDLEGGREGGKGVINEVEQRSLFSPTTLCFIPRFKGAAGAAVKSRGYEAGPRGPGADAPLRVHAQDI